MYDALFIVCKAIIITMQCRGVLAPVIESLIILDRLLYLKEQVCTDYYSPLASLRLLDHAERSCALNYRKSLGTSLRLVL